MKKSLASRTYKIDRTTVDTLGLRKAGLDSLRLKLHEDGTYSFIPTYNSLAEYSGYWDLSDDDDFSYFIFKFKNGISQKNRTLSIKVNGLWLHFTK